MDAILTKIPTISIHPNQVNFYYQYHWDPHRPSHDTGGKNHFIFMDDDGKVEKVYTNRVKTIIDSDRQAHGSVSKQAKKKITKGIDYLLLMANNKQGHSRYSGRFFNFKVAFITLTLPSTQIHDDKEIIGKCLNQLLIELKKVYKVRNYIWRAEKQNNNNIHFHILVDKFIPWQELKDRWNRIIEKLGYVTRYREQQQSWHKNGFRIRKELLETWSAEAQKKAYQRGAKTHWNSPNSTDIHSIRKIHNIKNYITKYLTKKPESKENSKNNNSEETKQTGRIWGCNHSLSNPTGARMDIDTKIEEELKKLMDDKTVYQYSEDYFSIFYISALDFQQKGLDRLFQLFSAYMFQTFGYAMQLEI